MNLERQQILEDTSNFLKSKIAKSILLLFVSLVAIFIGANMFIFTVKETEQAVVTRFGEVKKVIVDENKKDIVNVLKESPKFKDVKIVTGKGIFFKVPIIDNVEYYSNKLLTYDTNPREVTTKDKKKLILDNYAQWKIVNPALFRVSMKNERNAQTRLDDLIYSKLNAQIGRSDAHELISNKKHGEKMLTDLVDSVNKEIKSYGMEVVDIRIKRTELPTENYNNIFTRMKTERERQAKQYRSEGQEEAQKIRSEADKQATILEAKAYAEAEKIKGEGDAEALRIYANAYNKDVEFYKFYKTLETYKKTLKDKTKIVIDSNSEFAKYLKGNY